MRLLIAEPNLRDCWSARVLLSEAGHQVVGATTSMAAAAVLAEDTSPDLCLVDARLAGRARGGRPEGPDRLLLAGSFGFAPSVTLGWLAKPFGALDLLEAVAVCDGLLRREPPPSRIDRMCALTLVPPASSGMAGGAPPA